MLKDIGPNAWELLEIIVFPPRAVLGSLGMFELHIPAEGLRSAVKRYV